MRHGSLLPAVVLTTLAVFLTGCSRNPIAPSVGPAAGPGAGTASVIVPEDPAPPADGGTPISRTISLTADDEGVIVVGRWTLQLKKHTLTMPATITMTVVNPEANAVHIEVTPPEANNFAQWAYLTANMSDVPDVDYSTWAMFMWSAEWILAPTSSPQSKQQNITARFKTLTDCMVGPADKWKNKLGA